MTLQLLTLRWGRTGTRLEVEALPDGTRCVCLRPSTNPIARLAGCLRERSDRRPGGGAPASRRAMRFPHADTFAVATANMARAPVVTGDPEILSLPRDVVRIRRLQR